MLFVMETVYDIKSHTLSDVIFSVNVIALENVDLEYYLLKSIRKHLSVKTCII